MGIRGIRFFVSVISMVVASSAFSDGSATSGGGGTHTCVGGDLKVDSTELYDLYEAREAFGYTLVDATGKTANQLVFEAVKKIWDVSPFLATQITKKLQYYVNHKELVANKNWDIIRDAHAVFVDQGCQYQQIAQWRDRYESIFIDSALWDLFSKSELNRAGLAVHEAAYAFARSLGDIDSDASRALVAQAFSTAKIESGPGYTTSGKDPNNSSSGLYHLIPGGGIRPVSSAVVVKPASQYSIRISRPSSSVGINEEWMWFYMYDRDNNWTYNVQLKKGQTEIQFPINLGRYGSSGFYQYRTSMGDMSADQTRAIGVQFELLEDGVAIKGTQRTIEAGDFCGQRVCWNVDLSPGLTLQNNFEDFVAPTLQTLNF